MDVSYKRVFKAVYFYLILEYTLKKSEDTMSELFYIICLFLWHLLLQGNAYK